VVIGSAGAVQESEKQPGCSWAAGLVAFQIARELEDAKNRL